MLRIIGRLLISLAVLTTALIPIRSDWNDSHVFSTQWSPHARFHGIVSIGMPVLLAPVALWLLWRRTADQDAAATVAALIPVAYWGPFLWHSSFQGRRLWILGTASHALGAFRPRSLEHRQPSSWRDSVGTWTIEDGH
jgi:hypothetical protein